MENVGIELTTYGQNLCIQNYHIPIKGINIDLNREKSWVHRMESMELLDVSSFKIDQRFSESQIKIQQNVFVVTNKMIIKCTFLQSLGLNPGCYVC
jgi:hypothetical protein